MKKICGNRCLTIRTKKEMKKNLFMVAAVALLAFTACNKEEFNVGENAPAGTIEFTASLSDEDASTKTLYDNKKTKWETSDRISINGHEFKVEELLNDGLQAKFVNVKPIQSDFGSPFTAVYPYSADLSISTTTVNNVVVDSYPGLDSKGSNIAMAYIAEGNELSFKNITSMICFSVEMDGVTEVEISSNNGTNITGTAEVVWDNGTPKITNVANGNSTIVVKGNFVKGTSYYVNAIPTTIETGVTVRLNGIIAKSKKTSITLGRSKMMVSKGLKLEESGYDITGEFSDYGPTWSPGKGVKLYKEEGANWYVAKNVSITKGFEGDYAQFKITKGNWDESYGASNFEIGKWWGTANGNAYIMKGTYDIYFNLTSKQILATPVGSKALTVYLSWDNKTYLWFWSEQTEIANNMMSWPGAEGSKETIDNWGYAKWMVVIPAANWGQNMKYIFSNGTDDSKLETPASHKMTNVMFYNGENGEFLR